MEANLTTCCIRWFLDSRCPFSSHRMGYLKAFQEARKKDYLMLFAAFIYHYKCYWVQSHIVLHYGFHQLVYFPVLNLDVISTLNANIKLRLKFR